MKNLQYFVVKNRHGCPMNNLIFYGKYLSLFQIIDLLKIRIGFWVKAFYGGFLCTVLDFHSNMFSITSPSKLNENTKLQWCPPILGSLKFNVDASIREKTGITAIGCLLGNSSGGILAKFSIPVGVMDLNEAEVRAIKVLVVW